MLTAARNDLAIDPATFQVLKETLYPGAKDESIRMVLNYCKARKLDPLMRPVHLVPMSVKSGRKDGSGKDIYEFRDVVMPGISQYRIDASRSDKYAGMAEPEFGEEITKQIGSREVTFPKWCKITVKKIMPNGDTGEFSAKEFWLENYATKSRTDVTPNDMWAKRSFGQLAKCAEAQALRKAFPDVVGNEYTKEEMEGKTFDIEPVRPAITVSGEVQEIRDINKDVLEIAAAETLESLQEVYVTAYRYWMKLKHKTNLARIMETKDQRKSVLEFVDEMVEEEQKEEAK